MKMRNEKDLGKRIMEKRNINAQKQVIRKDDINKPAKENNRANHKGI